MAKSKNDTEFYVKLENIQLSADSIKIVEAGIQKLVMNELVGYTPDPDDPNPAPWPPLKWPPKGWKPIGPIIIRPPRPWPGLIARKLTDKDLKALGIVEKNIEIPKGF